jgi:pseudouridine-5'-phosphate glycosidase
MSVYIADDIRNAITHSQPIVALETAVLTKGLPRTPWSDEYGERPNIIDSELPINVALAQAMSQAIQSFGALPAWIAVVDGTLRIGLSPEEIVELGTNSRAGKVSIANLAQTMQQSLSAGTTVAATLLACKLASRENPIRVFATGGIGGVHTNWAKRLDISTDLTMLSTTPTCVVASGAKSILDIPATVETLETIGVPVLGLGNSLFPRFIEKNKSTDPHIHQVDSPIDVATICKHHWEHLGIQSAILATLPVPSDVALEEGELDEVLDIVENEWAALNQPSDTRTPFLLDRMAKLTEGKSLLANLALLCNNAGAAAEIAIELAKYPTPNIHV